MKQLTKEALALFDSFVEILLKWNEKINLTSYNRDELYKIALPDCYSMVLLLNHLKINEVLDLGTGYGMPGLVLKMLNKNIKITLLDASQKKVAFLEYVSRILDIDVSICQKRLPDKNFNKSFKCIISKASMEEEKLLKITKNLLDENGWLLYYAGNKGPVKDSVLKVVGAIHYKRADGSFSNIIIRKKIC
ncbi:MAG: 16S rRNA (guanine(527)-N(7))-methyltransferase RsmG [Proteobacteria bacterium]|nr:16S rRNA (guanine(527)-N(7))-methyltransferase RsmG [Pseudomonadota bacterium]